MDFITSVRLQVLNQSQVRRISPAPHHDRLRDRVFESWASPRLRVPSPVSGPLPAGGLRPGPRLLGPDADPGPAVLGLPHAHTQLAGGGDRRAAGNAAMREERAGGRGTGAHPDCRPIRDPAPVHRRAGPGPDQDGDQRPRLHQVRASRSPRQPPPGPLPPSRRHRTGLQVALRAQLSV